MNVQHHGIFHGLGCFRYGAAVQFNLENQQNVPSYGRGHNLHVAGTDFSELNAYENKRQNSEGLNLKNNRRIH